MLEVDGVLDNSAIETVFYCPGSRGDGSAKWPGDVDSVEGGGGCVLLDRFKFYHYASGRLMETTDLGGHASSPPIKSGGALVG